MTEETTNITNHHSRSRKAAERRLVAIQARLHNEGRSATSSGPAAPKARVMAACPHCRAVPGRAEQPWEDGEEWAVVCGTCGAQGPTAEAQVDAERLWNSPGLSRSYARPDHSK